jgi:hypothetical protein
MRRKVSSRAGALEESAASFSVMVRNCPLVTPVVYLTPDSSSPHEAGPNPVSRYTLWPLNKKSTSGRQAPGVLAGAHLAYNGTVTMEL